MLRIGRPSRAISKFDGGWVNFCVKSRWTWNRPNPLLLWTLKSVLWYCLCKSCLMRLFGWSTMVQWCFRNRFLFAEIFRNFYWNSAWLILACPIQSVRDFTWAPSCYGWFSRWIYRTIQERFASLLQFHSAFFLSCFSFIQSKSNCPAHECSDQNFKRFRSCSMWGLLRFVGDQRSGPKRW